MFPKREQENLCPKCSNRLGDGVRFCSKLGNPVQENREAQIPAGREQGFLINTKNQSLHFGIRCDIVKSMKYVQ